MSPRLNFEVISRSELPLPDPTASSPRRPVVLVVDDERVIADTLSIILTKSGFAVMTAYDGESALELANVIPPELLLTDVMLGPGMDGTQLAIEVVKASPECKILLFSGHAATRDLLETARKCGHNFALLAKPVHPADLLARIHESFASAETTLTR